MNGLTMNKIVKMRIEILNLRTAENQCTKKYFKNRIITFNTNAICLSKFVPFLYLIKNKFYT